MAGARRVNTGIASAGAINQWTERLVGLDDLIAPVIVGCSGGADSLALLALASARGLEPIAVHVDHGTRAGSAAEADAVAVHAERLGVEFHAERVDVAAGPNYEARARQARYLALEQARAQLGASAVVVGHTADDQAETVLLNVLRGSASAGLGAMPVVRDGIVRPLLELRRSDTEAVCATLGLTPLHDPSNDDVSLRRNWIRHEVLPVLSAGAGRDLVPVLARQSTVLREESEYLDALARAAWPSDGERQARTVAAMPLVLARRAIRIWLGSPPPSFDEVERVLAVARGDVKATEVAGGRRVWRTAGHLHADPRN
ncbi:MAG: tRNA lysidine(34) synthetase TilS [Actinobacteria bacterium]|nr:tRNA lysidine(34) synthetase TilS [Actinomycetota bacterium]